MAMSETDADLHYDYGHGYGLLYIVLPTIITIVACYVLLRLCGFKKAKCQAFLCNRVCTYIHNRFCKKEKALLFEHLKDFRNNYNNKGSSTRFNILEIGVGSGLNFKFFPNGSEVTALDPNPYNEKYLMDNYKKSENNVKFVKFIKGFAEKMKDVQSDTFDAVVCTFTMCSIRRLPEALEEIRRVLKPGGRFFFLEHVAAQKGSCIRFFQNKLQRIWPCISDGCNINRETWTFLDNSKFKDIKYFHFSAQTWLVFVARPGLYGSTMK